MNSSTRHSGFTLVGMLTAIAIIVILSTAGTIYYRDFSRKARNVSRVQGLETIKKALVIYYENHGHYPPAAGDTKTGAYEAPDCDLDWSLTVGGIGYGIRDDGSSSDGGLVDILQYEGYAQGYEDPLGANCKYITVMTSKDETQAPNLPCEAYPICDPPGPIKEASCASYNCSAGDVKKRSTRPHPDTYKQIQKYYLYCEVEGNEFEPALNDGGTPHSPVQKGEYFYELFEPDWWLCINHNADSLN